MQKIPEIFQRTDKDPAYKKVPVDPVYVFRGLRPSDPVNIPELAENRKCTDVIFLIFFVIGSLSLVITAAYIATSSDIRITINGKDKCGNVCGIKNTIIYSDSCSPLDYTNDPILLVSEEKCVTEDECKAKDMVIFLGRCFSPNSTEKDIKLDLEFWKSVEKWNPYTIIICAISPVIASVLAVLVFCLFQHQTKCAVNTFGTMSVLILIALACYFWYIFDQTLKQYGIRKSRTIFYLCSCILTTVVVLGITCLFCCCRYQIKFILRLYRETLDAIFNSKMLLFVPILGVAILVQLTLCWIYILMATVSVPVPQNSFFPVDRIIYLIFLVFMGFWIFNFFNACHCMTVAGTVASYYFARDKANLPSQYFKNLGIVFRFHLGTVAIGSLIITILKIIKIIMQTLLSEAVDADEDINALNVLSCIGACIASCVEAAVNYVNNKAYIITAFHGKSFCTSGKRAMQLIWTNFLDIISIDILNFTILLSAGVLIVFISLIISFAIIPKEDSRFIWICLGLALFLVGETIHLFFLTLSISLSTIFLCYCEDVSMNDGSGKRPYYMRPELQDAISDAFVEEAAAEEERKKPIFGKK